MRNIVLILLLLNFNAYSQNEITGKEQANLIASKQIKELKNGVLLVRLMTSENKINLLLKNGKNKAANKLKNDQYEINLEIAQALIKNYNFSDIYFFYSSDSQKVKDGNLKGIIKDDSLKNIEVDLTNRNIFVLNSTDVFLESTQSSVIGFSILNAGMEQLKKPFPYYVRKREGSLLFKRTYSEMAEVLNARLFDFYKQSN